MFARNSSQSSAVWTSDSAFVLQDGIEPGDRGRALAEARLRALHPLPEGKNHHSTDFEKRLRKIFERQTAEHVQPWLTLEFWQQEIDNMLVQGIFGRESTDSVVDHIHTVWPGLTTSWLRDRMEEVARAGLPRWVQNEFWVAEVDPILLVGIERSNRFRKEAIDRVLSANPGIQIAAVKARLLALRDRRSIKPEATSLANYVPRPLGVER